MSRAGLNDADLVTMLTSATGVPDQVALFQVASAVRSTTVELPGGANATTVANVLTMRSRPTWRCTTDQDREIARYPYQPYDVTEQALRARTARLFLPVEETHEVSLRAFAKAVAPPLVKARCFDVLWERFTRPSDAEDAIDAFLAFASDASAEAWTDADLSLGRAATLIGRSKDLTKSVVLLSAFERCAMTVLDSDRRYAFDKIADTFCTTVLRSKTLRASVPPEMLERWLLVLRWLAEFFFGRDPHFGGTCLLVLAEWFNTLGSPTEVTETRRRIVQHYLACASVDSALVGSSHASTALTTALQYGLSDLVEEAKRATSGRILDSRSEMTVQKFESTIPQALVDHLDAIVDGAPTAVHAIRNLAAIPGLCDVSVAGLRESAEQQLKEFLFMSLFPSNHMRNGKLTFVANDPASKLREAMGRGVDIHLSMIESLLARALHRLSGRISETTLAEAVVGASWLNQEHQLWLRRASERFQEEDYMSSGLIVAIHYEGVLRDLVRACGHSALKSDSSGILMDETLAGLLKQPLLRTALTENHVHFVEYVLADPELGPNMRNELAHGSASPWTLSAPRVLLLWLFIVRLTFFGPGASPMGNAASPSS